jgi:hypothetical protein
MARRATISYQHAIDAGIEAIKRHQMPLLASESSSTALLFIKATTFTNKAGSAYPVDSASYNIL